MEDYQEVLNRLPSKWEDVKLSTAIKYLNVEMQLPVEDEMENIERGLNNIFKTISVLSEVPLDEVREMPKVWIDRMAIKTVFMNKQPEPNKTSIIQWKTIDEVSYDDFITYTQLQGEEIIDKMPMLIKSMAKSKMNEDEILAMNIVDVNTSFFFLRKQLIKFTRGLITSSKKLLRKQRLQEKLQKRILTKEKSIVKN